MAGARTKPAGKVRVSVLDHAATSKVGINGLAFTVARTDAADPGAVGIQLDYSGFSQAFGGAYGTRLRLFQVPACTLTTPAEPECGTTTPVQAVNNGQARTLTAQVTAQPAISAGGGTLLVAAAEGSGSQGDYKATSLEPSATWSAGGNSGGFNWTYPMRVPPVPSGMTPKVEISYSSSSVDGKTANTNGQPSWVGEGFELHPGFIERRYKSCEDDGAPKDEWGNSPGDQCWGYDNATVTWNGKGGELIKAADGTWRMKGDDGTKFEKLAGTARGNGDNDGEYWKVTTTDGTQYYFGYNRLPGWTSGKPETGSTWTAPVFGDDSGEPCHDSAGFAGSWCQQAYRWNLDYVVDPVGNVVSYTYQKETNHYGRNLKAEDETPYVRGGHLKSISYGLRQDNLFATAPAQVVFDTAERCIPDTDFDCDPSQIGSHPQYWWDVPWDLNCNSGQECKDNHGTLAPTFWSRKRLTKVTTQIAKADGSGHRPVDSWTLGHDWGEADVERDFLLEEIQHTGHAADGVTTKLPKVTFNHVQLPNRLDKSGDDILAYIRYRLGAIYDESGGQIDISYSAPDCTLDNLPTPQTNTRRCMPVIWQPPGREDPITDWFHKYVVTSVIQTDRTGLSPDMATKYDYVGGAAWHFDDDDGLTKEKNKTWSQWRGYGHVRTYTGSFNDPAAQTDTFYLRGMDADRLNRDGGTKQVSVSDSEGGTHTDHDALAGFTLKTVTYDAPGGNVHAKSVNTPWRVQTASRNRSWGTTTANVVTVDTSRTWTVKDGGGWIETKTDTDYETSGPGVGRVKSVNDLGDTSRDDDDQCTRTSYADNTGAHMVVLPSRVESVAVACTAEADRSTQVISDVRTFYDNGGFGDAPTRGDVTRVEEIASHDGQTATYVPQARTRYDVYGRATEVTDALDQVTTTAYTDTQGLNTKITTTTPPARPGVATSALVTVTDLDPAWGLPVTKIDQSNQLRTDLVYDPLGRLAKVWLPDQSKANEKPNYQYDYGVTDGQITVTRQTLTATGGQRVASIELLDGWLRPRQTQAPGPTGRLVSDTFHDERGQVVKTYAPYPAAGAPSTTLFGVDTPGDIESQSHTEYDGLGRKTVERLTKGNGAQPEMELWRTTYTYGGGNRASVTPPNGGTPTAEITNARGQVIQRRQYKATTPTGDYDATTYTYTPAGEIASVTDPSGNTFTTTYDLRGRQTRTTDPDKGTTQFGYDDLDRLTSATDARGNTIVTEYDGLGRKTATRDGTATGPLLTSYTYDTAIRGKGKLANSIRHGANGNNYTNAIRRYDSLGRPDNTAVTIPASEGPLAGTFIFAATYRQDETLASYSMPTAGGLSTEAVLFDYDEYLRPTRMTSGQGTYIGATGYTPTGKPIMLEMGTEGARAWNTMTWEWGTQRLATSRTFREGIDGDDRNATYTYTDAGSITSITDASRDGIDKQCFTYDYLNRLTQAWTQPTTGDCATTPTATGIGGPAPYWHSYGYDTAGNRTSETLHGVNGQVDTHRTYTYASPGQGNRLTQMAQTGAAGARTDTYTYDDTGNTTGRTTATNSGTSPQTLDWNTEGELTKVTQNGTDTTFVYDTEGNRLIRKDATGATLYLPGMELRADTGATTATATRYYSYNGQTVAMRTPTGVTYLTGDHQGTSQIAITAPGLSTTVRRSSPFGAVRGLDEDATWPNDKGFVGGTQDPTGYTHLGAREYDPETGRFISVDPLLDQADPQQMNGYTYANNSPVTNSDPDGQMPAGGPDPGWAQANGHWNCVRNGGGSCGSPVYTPPNYGIPSRVVYPVSYPKIQDRRTRQYIYRIITENFVFRPPNPKTHPEAYKIGLQGQLAFCQEFGDDSLCNSAPGGLHAFLDIVGMTPGLGEAADLANALAYALEGKWKDAGISVAAVLPLVGTGAAAARLARRAGRVRPCSSFVPGTSVVLADGSSKPIEDVQVGDKVLATDPETGSTEAKPVLATITSKGKKNLVQIAVDTTGPRPSWTTDDKLRPGAELGTGSETGLIIATDAHPFWVAGDINRWVDAADLQPGMWLRTSAGTYVQIAHVKTWTKPDQRVHNLTVADHHTYYVLAGQTPVLVHNSTCPEVDEISKNISKHALDSAKRPDGDGTHFVRGVDDGALPYYVDGVINGNVPNVKIRYLRNGRVGYWDPDKRSVVLEDGEGGTVFTPKGGKDWFDHVLR